MLHVGVILNKFLAQMLFTSEQKTTITGIKISIIYCQFTDNINYMHILSVFCLIHVHRYKLNIRILCGRAALCH